MVTCLLLMLTQTIHAQTSKTMVYTLHGEIMQDTIFPVGSVVVFENYCFGDSAVKMECVRFKNAMIADETGTYKVRLTYATHQDSIYYCKLESEQRKSTTAAWNMLRHVFGEPADSVYNLVSKRYHWQNEKGINTVAQFDKLSGKMWFRQMKSIASNN